MELKKSKLFGFFDKKLRKLVKHESDKNEENVPENFVGDQTNMQLSTGALLLRDLPLVEAAFSLEKVKKSETYSYTFQLGIFGDSSVRLKIFSQLDLPDIKNCRLVCHTWKAYISSTKLLDGIFIRISIRLIIDKRGKKQIVVSPLKSKSEWTQPLKKFHKSLNNFDDSFLPLSVFINNAGHILDDPEVKKFLQAHGFRFKMASVRISNDYGSFNYPSNYQRLMKIIRDLITEQMQNLEYLYLDFYTIFCHNCACDFEEEFGEISPDHLRLLSLMEEEDFKCNRNLRCLKTRELISHALLQYICSLAPNLEETDVFSSSGSFCHKQQKYFTWPKNRTHLIKKFVYNPTTGTNSSEKCNARPVIKTELMDKLQNLKKLTLCFFWCENDHRCWPQVAEAVVELLTKHCESLEMLCLSRMRFLPLTCEQIPLMPNVKCVRFIRATYYRHITFNEHFFPMGLNVSETFPNLEKVELPFGLDDEEPGNVEQLIFENEEDVVASVRVVTAAQNSMQEAQAQKRFPNAVITHAVVHPKDFYHQGCP